MTTASFIAHLKQESTRWSPYNDDWLSPDWFAGWDNATELEKVNLAHGWLWTLNNYLDNQPVTNDDVLRNAWSTLVPRMRSMQPYIRPDFITRQNLGERHEWFTLLLFTSRVNQHTDLSVGHQLWFGDETACREALITWASLPDKRDLLFQTGNLTSVLAWQLANAEDAPARLAGYAAAASYFTGKDGLLPPDDACPAQLLWQHIGLHDKQKNVLLVETQEAYRDALRDSNEDALLVALSLILPDALKLYDEKLIFCTDTYFASIATAGSTIEASTFDLLRMFIPGKTSMWNMAEELGLTYQDACAMALQGGQPGAAASLPELLASDIGERGLTR